MGDHTHAKSYVREAIERDTLKNVTQEVREKVIGNVTGECQSIFESRGVVYHCGLEAGHDTPSLPHFYDHVAKNRQMRWCSWDGNQSSPATDAPASPGEYGHYSALNPEPIEVIEAWGLNHHEAEALAHLVRHRRKEGKLDLEKAVWWINRLIALEYGSG